MRDHADRRDLNMWSWTSQCLYARSAAGSSKYFWPSRMHSHSVIHTNDAKHEHIVWTPQKRLFGTCSRQFNHRCKGISMASFKPEEIRALENGGNGVSACDWTSCCSLVGRTMPLTHVSHELFKLFVNLRHLRLDPPTQVALAAYLAKWNPRDAPKPIDRCAALLVAEHAWCCGK